MAAPMAPSASLPPRWQSRRTAVFSFFRLAALGGIYCSSSGVSAVSLASAAVASSSAALSRTPAEATNASETSPSGSLLLQRGRRSRQNQAPAELMTESLGPGSPFSTPAFAPKKAAKSVAQIAGFCLRPGGPACMQPPCCCWSTYAADEHAAYDPADNRDGQRCVNPPQGFRYTTNDMAQYQAVVNRNAPRFDGRRLCCLASHEDPLYFSGRDTAQIVPNYRNEMGEPVAPMELPESQQMYWHQYMATTTLIPPPGAMPGAAAAR